MWTKQEDCGGRNSYQQLPVSVCAGGRPLPHLSAGKGLPGVPGQVRLPGGSVPGGPTCTPHVVAAVSLLPVTLGTEPIPCRA